MKALLPKLAVVCSLIAITNATETGDILSAFNDAYIEGPSTSYSYWEGTGSIQSNAFQNYYRKVYAEYFALSNSLSNRTVACVNGDIPQAEGYIASPSIPELAFETKVKKTRNDEFMEQWLTNGDETALQALDESIPAMTIAYGKMLFELSKCSGFLYGELVN
jgi:hypothetical protein